VVVVEAEAEAAAAVVVEANTIATSTVAVVEVAVEEVVEVEETPLYRRRRQTRSSHHGEDQEAAATTNSRVCWNGWTENSILPTTTWKRQNTKTVVGTTQQALRFKLDVPRVIRLLHRRGVASYSPRQ
jgi:phage gpG-like protein